MTRKINGSWVADVTLVSKKATRALARRMDKDKGWTRSKVTGMTADEVNSLIAKMAVTGRPHNSMEEAEWRSIIYRFHVGLSVIGKRKKHDSM